MNRPASADERADRAAAAAGDAYVRAWQRDYYSETPIDGEWLTQAARQLLEQIGTLVAIDDIIPGHLKLLLKAGEDGIMMSMTRIGSIDEVALSQWPPSESLSAYSMTVNFLLLTPADINEEDVMSAAAPASVESKFHKK